MKTILFIGIASFVLVNALLFSGCTTTTSTNAAAPSGSQEIATGYKPIQSELIYSVNYDEPTQTLTVVLYDEGVYDYENVPAAQYEALLKADDHDAYYKSNIAKKFKGKKFAMD